MNFISDSVTPPDLTFFSVQGFGEVPPLLFLPDACPPTTPAALHSSLCCSPLTPPLPASIPLITLLQHSWSISPPLLNPFSMLHALLCSDHLPPFFPLCSSRFQFLHAVPVINIWAFIVALNVKARNHSLFCAAFFSQIPQLVTFFRRIRSTALRNHKETEQMFWWRL